ncbi:MAG: hypothetical protein K8S15_11830 [Candidatus Aegiribacteria sp.]|nr:hypothetical protein [Candidatus Aegiribacteria sp.]
MISTAPDERLGCQAFHLPPGGEWWALSAYIRTNTTPDSRRTLLSRLQVMYHVLIILF